MAEAKVGFAKPEKGKVIHVVVDGKQACDKKIALTADPELQVTSVTCKKCQRFAFFKEIVAKGQPKAKPTAKKSAPKKKPKKKILHKGSLGNMVILPGESPEEAAERIATEADRKAAKKKAAKKDPAKAPGPVKHTKVNANRKTRRTNKKLVQAVQEALVVALAPFQKEKIVEITLMRVFEETEAKMKELLAGACDDKKDKEEIKKNWKLPWKTFIAAFDGLKFCKLKGKDHDKGKLVLLYDDKAKTSERKIKRRGSKASGKAARTIRRRKKDEPDTKTRKIRRRKDTPKEEKKSVAKKNGYGHRLGSMADRIDELLSPGFRLADAVAIICDEFKKEKSAARRKIQSHCKSMARKLGIRISVEMGKDENEDFYRIVAEK